MRAERLTSFLHLGCGDYNIVLTNIKSDNKFNVINVFFFSSFFVKIDKKKRKVVSKRNTFLFYRWINISDSFEIITKSFSFSSSSTKILSFLSLRPFKSFFLKRQPVLQSQKKFIFLLLSFFFLTFFWMSFNCFWKFCQWR